MENVKGLNEMEINKLTEEDVEVINKTLEESVSPTTESLREIMASTEYDNAPYPNNVLNTKYSAVEAMVDIDPDSGEKRIALDTPLTMGSSVDVSDIENGEDLVKLDEVTAETKKEFFENLSINETDALKILELIRMNDNGEQVKYEQLPNMLKDMVDNLCGIAGEGGTKMSKKTVIKDVLSFFKTELQTDQEYINFQEALEKELSGYSIVEEYSKESDEKMITSLNQYADECEESNPEKAKLMRDISDAYKGCKDFKIFTDALDSNNKATRRLEREVKRFNKYVRDFNFKYTLSKYTIPGLELTAKVIERHTGEIDKAKELLILFMKLTMNMQPENTLEHVIMYYTLRNICNLDIYRKDSDIYKETLDKLTNILDRL